MDQALGDPDTALVPAGPTVPTVGAQIQEWKAWAEGSGPARGKPGTREQPRMGGRTHSGASKEGFWEEETFERSSGERGRPGN